MAINALDVLRERGFVQQVTNEAAVRELFAKGPVSAYVGYDPTADSLHVGHLFTLMALVHLERLGHRPIVVLGGGTAMVGDPSGKTELRQMLTREAIVENTKSIGTQVNRLLDVAGGKTVVVDNAEWLLGLHYIDFLRDIGRHFSVNRMLTADAYKLRLEKGLSFIEFNYQLLQSYDFVELCRRYDCRLQMGGDDQWGNIVAGVDLCRRVEKKEVEGLTFPLQLTATGEKMGKTAAGAVWLSAERLPVHDYYQYWVNVHDDDLVRMLGYFTLLPMAEVHAVATLEGAERNIAKSILAFEATKLVHGEAAAQHAHAAAQSAFGGRTLPATLLPSSTVPRAATTDASQIPTLVLTQEELAAGLPLAALMVRCGLSASNSEARRAIEANAVKLGERKVTDARYTLGASDLEGGELLVWNGKKKVHRLTRG